MRSGGVLAESPVALAVLASTICAIAPLIAAVQHGVRSMGEWAGGAAIGYFALVAGFVPICAALGRLFYFACREALGVLSTGNASDRLGFVATVTAGTVMTQAVAQIGRWSFVPEPPRNALDENWHVLGEAIALHVVSAPIVETALLALVLSLARTKVPRRVLIPLAAGAFGTLHAIEHPFWLFPSATLFAYCAAVYLREAQIGRTWRAFLLAASVHMLNNAVGLSVIVAHQALALGH